MFLGGTRKQRPVSFKKPFRFGEPILSTKTFSSSYFFIFWTTNSPTFSLFSALPKKDRLKKKFSLIFIQVENTLRQVGSGTRPVDWLHLSGQNYWGMNFNFPLFWAFLDSFLSSNLALSNVCCQNDKFERNLAFYFLKMFWHLHRPPNKFIDNMIT